MNSKNIKVVRVGQSGVTGTPDEFEMHYAKRRKGSVRSTPSTPQPKLQPLKNPSMQDRVEDFNLGES